MSYNFNPLIRFNFETKGVQFSPFSTGAIPFALNTSALGQDSGNLFWNNSSKSLGLGTNAPLNSRLHIRGNNFFTTGLRFSSSLTGTPHSDVGMCPATNVSNANLPGENGAAGLLIFSYSNAATIAKFTQTGNFGIREVNPIANLHVSDSTATGPTCLLQAATNHRISFGVSGGTGAGLPLGHYWMGHYHSGLTRMSMSPSGNFRLGSGAANDLVRLEVSGSTQVGLTDFVYFGPPNVDGSVRLGIVGTDFVTQIRVSSNWVTKGTVSLL